LVWSANHSGHTPVDLEWVRHIESGKGFYTARSFYPLEPSGIRKHCFKQDEYYQDLLREAVEQVIQTPRPEEGEHSDPVRENDAKGTFGVFLDRLSLLVMAAASSVPDKCSPTLLHDVCKLSTPYGPSLPLSLMELFLWVHRRQLLTQDQFGNLPLHYALCEGTPLSKPSQSQSCDDWKFFVQKLLQEAPESSKLANRKNRLPLHILLDHSSTCSLSSPTEIQQARQEVTEELVRLFPECVDRRDPVTNLDPFLLAAKDSNLQLDSVFYLLRHSPSRCGDSGS
jgi:hypothetical protein